MPSVRHTDASDVEPPEDEHAVTTHLPLSGGEYGAPDEREALFAVEERIAGRTDDPSARVERVELA